MPTPNSKDMINFFYRIEILQKYDVSNPDQEAALFALEKMYDWLTGKNGGRVTLHDDLKADIGALQFLIMNPDIVQRLQRDPGLTDAYFALIKKADEGVYLDEFDDIDRARDAELLKRSGEYKLRAAEKIVEFSLASSHPQRSSDMAKGVFEAIWKNQNPLSKEHKQIAIRKVVAKLDTLPLVEIANLVEGAEDKDVSYQKMVNFTNKHQDIVLYAAEQPKRVAQYAKPLPPVPLKVSKPLHLPQHELEALLPKKEEKKPAITLKPSGFASIIGQRRQKQANYLAEVDDVLSGKKWKGSAGNEAMPRSASYAYYKETLTPILKHLGTEAMAAVTKKVLASNKFEAVLFLYDYRGKSQHNIASSTHYQILNRAHLIAQTVQGDIATSEAIDSVTEGIFNQRNLNLNARDFSGSTPLHLAVMTQQDDLVQYLLQEGANPSIPNKEGKTAFEMMMNDRWMFNALWKATADEHVRSTLTGQQKAAITMEQIKRYNADNESTYHFDGEKASQYYLMFKHTLADLNPKEAKEVLATVMNAGDPLAVSAAYTVLGEHPSIGKQIKKSPQYDLAYRGMQIAMGAKLVKPADSFANVSASSNQDPLGNSLLHVAVATGQADVAAHLVEKGAKLFMPNKERKTAIDIARTIGDKEVRQQIDEAFLGNRDFKATAERKSALSKHISQHPAYQEAACMP